MLRAEPWREPRVSSSTEQSRVLAPISPPPSASTLCGSGWAQSRSCTVEQLLEVLTPSFSVLLSCVSVACGTWSMSLCFKSCAESPVPLHPLTSGLRVFGARLALLSLKRPGGIVTWRPGHLSTSVALCSQDMCRQLCREVRLGQMGSTSLLCLF